MKKRYLWAGAIMALTILLAFTSCASSKGYTPPAGRTAINVSANAETVTFLLEENDTAKSLLAELPLEVELSQGVDNISFDVIGTLETGSDKPIEKGEVGDMVYNPNTSEVTIFYSGFNALDSVYLIGKSVEGTESIWALGGEAWIGSVE